MIGVSEANGIDSIHEGDVAAGSVLVASRYTVVDASTSTDVEASMLRGKIISTDTKWFAEY